MQTYNVWSNNVNGSILAYTEHYFPGEVNYHEENIREAWRNHYLYKKQLPMAFYNKIDKSNSSRLKKL